MNPRLSVVVIGRNEGARLERCLESVRQMNFPQEQVELIYVDSASTDGSPEAAARFGARVIPVQPTRPTAALGRNAGWRAAKAPIVLFLDGDTILHPDFVARSLPHFDDAQVAVVWGHRREIRPGDSLFNRVLDLDWIYPPGESDFCGGDALIRRFLLLEIDGYDESLIAGEEPEMCHRIRALGYRILHVDRPMTGHDLAMRRWSQYWKRSVRAGYAYGQVSARFHGSAMPFWEHESRHNLVRGSLLISLVPATIAACLLTASWLPAAVAVLAAGAVILRTALKVGWKCENWSTRLLYAVHSHFQHLPIFAGQWKYRNDRRAGRIRQLIEYKEVPS